MANQQADSLTEHIEADIKNLKIPEKPGVSLVWNCRDWDMNPDTTSDCQLSVAVPGATITHPPVFRPVEDVREFISYTHELQNDYQRDYEDYLLQNDDISKNLGEYIDPDGRDPKLVEFARDLHNQMSEVLTQDYGSGLEKTANLLNTITEVAREHNVSTSAAVDVLRYGMNANISQLYSEFAAVGGSSVDLAAVYDIQEEGLGEDTLMSDFNAKITETGHSYPINFEDLVSIARIADSKPSISHSIEAVVSGEVGGAPNEVALVDCRLPESILENSAISETLQSTSESCSLAKNCVGASLDVEAWIDPLTQVSSSNNASTVFGKMDDLYALQGYTAISQDQSPKDFPAQTHDVVAVTATRLGETWQVTHADSRQQDGSWKGKMGMMDDVTLSQPFGEAAADSPDVQVRYYERGK